MKPRKINEVMDRIRPLLVQGGVDVGPFDAIARSAGFTAPEEMRERWLELCEWLALTCPNPIEDGAPAWVVQVSAIIEGRDG